MVVEGLGMGEVFALFSAFGVTANPFHGDWDIDFGDA
jgi:hypothetical protein